VLLSRGGAKYGCGWAPMGRAVCGWRAERDRAERLFPFPSSVNRNEGPRLWLFACTVYASGLPANHSVAFTWADCAADKTITVDVVIFDNRN
jgi:hypothetical protein